MQLALFDLDHTLLPIDSADTWSHHVVRRGGLDAETTAHASGISRSTYQAGTFDVDGYVRFQMELLARFPRAALDAWHAEFMEQYVRPARAARSARAGRPPPPRGRRTGARHRHQRLRRHADRARVRHRARARGRARSRERGVHRRLGRNAHLPGRQGAQGRGVAGPARARLVGRAHRLLQRFDQRPAAARTRDRACRHERRCAAAAIARERGWPTLQLFERAAE